MKPAVENYANIGVRIEDDVLITESGHEILSKKMDDIERLMKNRSSLMKKYWRASELD